MLFLLNMSHVELSQRQFLKQHLCELVTKMYCTMKKSCCYFVIQVLPSYTLTEQIVKPLSTSVMAVWWDSIWLLISKINWSWSCFELQKTWCKFWNVCSVILKDNTVLFCASGWNITVLKLQEFLLFTCKVGGPKLGWL